MKKYIVITTINPMNEVLRRFASLEGWKLVVVGDRKGPAGIDDPRVEFLGIERQQELGYASVQSLPENHYCRKNVGYLYAMSKGADLIAESDDDNYPERGWGRDVCFSLRGARFVEGERFHNADRNFTSAHIWPRGFPLARITDPGSPRLGRRDAEVGVWQGLADREPDVDAIYRLTVNRQVTFGKRPPLVLAQHVYCPFNSQNTFWRPESFPFMFLPATVSPRFTDILRGYVAQRMLWEQGRHLAFGRASVYQDRNVHDLMRDFRDEVEMYQGVEKAVEVLESLTLGGGALEWQVEAYRRLAIEGIVAETEVALARAWAQDVRASGFG